MANGRGVPRKVYRRKVYVLLSPACGPDWAAAAARVVKRRKWSMGWNLDDAGLGDLERRTAIVVNSEDFGIDVPEFFFRHYPGVQYVDVRAFAPDDLTAELTKLNGNGENGNGKGSAA